MATLEQALVSYLSAHAGLSALVSGRLYPTRIPQGAVMPCVVYQRVDTPRTTAYDSVGATGDLARVKIDFDCWSSTLDKSMQVAAQLRAALHGKIGLIGTAPNAVTIRAALVFNEVTDFSPETKLFRIIASYNIWQEEA